MTGVSEGSTRTAYLRKHILVQNVAKGSDHAVLSPGGVSSALWVQVLSGGSPWGWAGTVVTGRPYLSNHGTKEHSYLVSRSCEFSSSRFPTSLPIPETKGEEVLCLLKPDPDVTTPASELQRFPRG